jgi:sporulation protein YlmC with PRC-barrel domain
MRDTGARHRSGISTAGRHPDGTALAFETGMTLNDQALHGRVVLSGDGLAIGEITRLNVEPATWHVISFEVKVRKEISERIGVHRSMFHTATIVIPTEHVQSVGDAVILSVPLAALRREPEREPEPAPAPH